jgi:hypothetical protein
MALRGHYVVAHDAGLYGLRVPFPLNLTDIAKGQDDQPILNQLQIGSENSYFNSPYILASFIAF